MASCSTAASATKRADVAVIVGRFVHGDATKHLPRKFAIIMVAVGEDFGQMSTTTPASASAVHEADIGANIFRDLIREHPLAEPATGFYL